MGLSIEISSPLARLLLKIRLSYSDLHYQNIHPIGPISISPNHGLHTLDWSNYVVLINGLAPNHREPCPERFRSSASTYAASGKWE